MVAGLTGLRDQVVRNNSDMLLDFQMGMPHAESCGSVETYGPEVTGLAPSTECNGLKHASAASISLSYVRTCHPAHGNGRRFEAITLA